MRASALGSRGAESRISGPAATVPTVVRNADVVPMSERRLVIAVLGVLASATGLAMALLALLGLRHPVGGSGELGTPTDFSGVLVGLLLLGGALAVAGAATAAALVHAQLRRAAG